MLTLRDVDPHLLPDDDNLIGVAPGFADEPNDDLRLATGSLAYEAGMQANPFDRMGPTAEIGPEHLTNPNSRHRTPTQPLESCLQFAASRGRAQLLVELLPRDHASGT